MAKKKIKFPVPESGQIWKDAMVLLQYAFRLEKEAGELEGDHAALLMLSGIHQLVEGFRKSRRDSASQGIDAQMVGRLAVVYKKVVRGELKDENAYREAILNNMVAIFADENEDANDPSLVPGFLLMAKKTIISEGGPLEAAAKSVAEYCDRSPRQLMEYRSRMKKGNLIFRPLEAFGGYMPNYDLCRAVLIKTLGIEPGLATEIADYLKSKSASKPYMTYKL